MTNQHPITPPPELVQQWASESLATQNLCNRAAQWGADQELKACSMWIEDELCMPPDARADVITKLNAARRPKPPSLKEQAQQSLLRLASRSNNLMSEDAADMETIRRALEALPE